MRARPFGHQERERERERVTQKGGRKGWKKSLFILNGRPSISPPPDSRRPKRRLLSLSLHTGRAATGAMEGSSVPSLSTRLSNPRIIENMLRFVFVFVFVFVFILDSMGSYE